MRNLTSADFRSLWPNAADATVLGILAVQEKAFVAAGITKAIRLAHLMAQLSHESGAGTTLEENLDYRASRLMAVFPKYFPSLKSTEGFDHRPERIANKVYGARLGNKERGDGWRYRGRGFVQLTGRANYEKLGALAGLDLVGSPELLTESGNAFLVSVLWFGSAKGMLAACDADEIVRVTRLVNGGLNGLDERRSWLFRWRGVLGL